MARTPTKKLAVDLIRTDGQTQSRAEIDESTVSDYAELWERAKKTDYPFDQPVDVFHDGTDYWCADGFHRVLAASRAKRATVLAKIHSGTVRDAFLFSAKCNVQHGKRRTNADKRHLVERFLRDDEWGGKTDGFIADACCVSRQFVRILRDEQGATVAPSTKRTGKDGKQYPAKTNRSKPPASSQKNAEKPDYGQCPNCAGIRWKETEFGVECSKCHHPHGEPAGDVDDDRITTQRQKTVKTVEALMRAFDDLHLICPKAAEHANSIAQCKCLLSEARAWK